MEELFDHYDYSAVEQRGPSTVEQAYRDYETKGWCLPVSGDATTLEIHHRVGDGS